MSDTENDEDFKRAIALSLMSPDPDSHPPYVNILSSDEEEDDDLDRPLTARPITSARANTGKKSSPFAERSQEVVIDSSTPSQVFRGAETHAPPMSSGVLGLNRKQMEDERLARAAMRNRGEQDASMTATPPRKRKASTSPASSRDRVRLVKESSRNSPKSFPTTKTKRDFRASADATSAIPRKGTFNLAQPHNKAFETRITQPNEHSISSPSSPRSTSDTTAKAQEQVSATKLPQSFNLSSIQYPDGVVKKTWAFGYNRQGDDIKIEEVFQKNDLEIAVLSAFQLDADWVMSKLNSTTKVVWVLQAKDEAQKQNWASGAPQNFRFCFPSMEGNVNCMHSKLQLLAHPTHLRIAVPSANLTPYDWGETGVMENVCFLIDLPRLPEGQETQLEQLTQFGKELLNFLRAMGLDKSQIESMRRFDFSRTAHLAFVHSIGGSHTGTQLSTTGLCGLGKAVRDLELNTEGALNIDFLAASIGSLNENFMKSMYLAAKGDNGLTAYGWRPNKPARAKGLAPDFERKVSDELKSRCRIYFPSQETVEQSKGGAKAGGTICFQSTWFFSESFPRYLMRDCKSLRKGLLMHSKMIFVRLEKAGLRSNVAWAYVGSANLSESAWGRLVRDKTSKEMKINLRNWECGVLISIPRSLAPAGEAADRVAGVGDRLDMSVFDGRIPVPMIVPGEEYGVRRPWFYNEQ